MTATALRSATDSSTSSFSSEESVRGFMRGLLAQLYPQGKVFDRRRDRRFPFPNLIRLTPVDADGRPVEGDAMVVAGKHLSESGLGFFHPEPITPRHVIVTLASPTGQQLELLLDLSWCRFTSEGWYESGGRFLRLF